MNVNDIYICTRNYGSHLTFQFASRNDKIMVHSIGTVFSTLHNLRSDKLFTIPTSLIETYFAEVK